jgi:hypothetical protein
MENTAFARAANHFALAERPDDAISLYSHLFHETMTSAGELGRELRLSPWPQSSVFFFSDYNSLLIRHPEIENANFNLLIGKWWRYALLHQKILDRSPLMELEHYLSQISESHASTSWSDHVVKLPEWIDEGAKGFPPIDDRDGVMTKRIIDRMTHIRATTKGWLYGYIWGNYFLTDAQLREVPSDEPFAYLEATRTARPSFEGL